MKTLRDMARIAGRVRSAMVIAVMMIGLRAAVVACPNCGFDTMAEGAGLKDGFTYSIIGMASMPFLIAAAAAGLIIRARRGGASTPGGDGA